MAGRRSRALPQKGPDPWAEQRAAAAQQAEARALFEKQQNPMHVTYDKSRSQWADIGKIARKIRSGGLSANTNMKSGFAGGRGNEGTAGFGWPDSMRSPLDPLRGVQPKLDPLALALSGQLNPLPAVPRPAHMSQQEWDMRGLFGAP